MTISKKDALEELRRRKQEKLRLEEEQKRRDIEEKKEQALAKIAADKKAIEDSITEKTLLKDLKGLISDAIPKLQSQNDVLIKTATASLGKEDTDTSVPVIKALQLQTKEIIDTLEELEVKASKAKWVLKTELIERGRDGNIVSMEVSAYQI